MEILLRLSALIEILLRLSAFQNIFTLHSSLHDQPLISMLLVEKWRRKRRTKGRKQKLHQFSGTFATSAVDGVEVSQCIKCLLNLNQKSM